MSRARRGPNGPNGENMNARRSIRKELAPRPRRARAGFTFLEITIVIVIMGTLLILTIPSMRSLQDRNRLVAASRELAAMFRLARGQAILGERTVEVRFDMVNGRYRLDLNPTEEELLRRHRQGRELRRQEENIQRLPEGVNFADVFVWTEQINERGHVVVEFYPNGSASPLVLVLADREGKSVTVEVARSSGRVSIQPGRPEGQPRLPSQDGIVEEEIVVIE